MKWIVVFFVMFLVGCGPDIRIADEVIVIDGFYKGCTGRVQGLRVGLEFFRHDFLREYQVKLFCENRGVEIHTTQIISGSSLEVIR